MQRQLGLLTFLILFFFTGQGQNYTVETLPNPVEQQSYVINPDGILSQNTVDEINAKVGSLVAEKRGTVVVAAVNSIGSDVPEEFANRLYDKWGIGIGKTGAGVLLLMVQDQRRVVIRTGYGVEGTLTDYTSNKIIRDNILPRFRSGDFDGGVVAGVASIISVIKEGPKAVEKTNIDWKSVVPYTLAVYLLIILVSLLWLQNSVKYILQNKTYKTNLSRQKAIQQTTAAQVSVFMWIIPLIGFVVLLVTSKLTYILFLLPLPFIAIPAYLYGKKQAIRAKIAPITCDVCNHEMHILNEQEDDKYLTLSQQLEEKLNAVNYDVFICDNCKNEAVFTEDKFSQYTKCPSCQTKAYILSHKATVVAPTYFNSGTERLTYKCKYCGYKHDDNRKTPRITRSGAVYGGAVGGSIFSGRGGFGGSGGGFSGGFGGGMTGGGGASGGW